MKPLLHSNKIPKASKQSIIPHYHKKLKKDISELSKRNNNKTHPNTNFGNDENKNLGAFKSGQSGEFSYVNDERRNTSHTNELPKNNTLKVTPSYFDQNKDTQETNTHFTPNSVKNNSLKDQPDILNINHEKEMSDNRTRNSDEGYNITPNKTTANNTLYQNFTNHSSTESSSTFSGRSETYINNNDASNDEPYVITQDTTTLDQYHDIGNMTKRFGNSKHSINSFKNTKNSEDFESTGYKLNDASTNTGVFRDQRTEEISRYSSHRGNNTTSNKRAVVLKRSFEMEDTLNNARRNSAYIYFPKVINSVFPNKMVYKKRYLDGTVPINQNNMRHISGIKTRSKNSVDIFSDENIAPMDQNNVRYSSEIKTRSKNPVDNLSDDRYDEEYDDDEDYFK
ncbi:hypothetical protein NPIL_603401 [Nephila pilipes]|uniref:Uncharacterized protein n=1 Tax=Nephila pilipes TaxID=299642 RepID=A0A8X6UPT5_NEPPI|nr:hypothetical protein NPIL_603401 [Nephila pilipes]